MRPDYYSPVEKILYKKSVDKYGFFTLPTDLLMKAKVIGSFVLIFIFAKILINMVLNKRGVTVLKMRLV